MEFTFGQNHTTWRSTGISCIKNFQGTSQKGKLEMRNAKIMFGFLDPLLYSDLMQLFHNFDVILALHHH